MPKGTGLDAPRLQGALAQWVEAQESGKLASGNQIAAEEAALPLNATLDGDRILVVVEGDISRLQSPLAALGGEIDSVARDRLSVLAPISALRDVAALEGVDYVRLPLPAVALQAPQAGSVTSEGVAVINADAWHSNNYTGEGIKAAIIDFGFYNWTGLQASDDLPVNTVCVDFTTGSDCGNTDTDQAHGTACAEILYDVAPGIDTLYLYAFDDDADISAIVDDMIANDVDVASMSIGWVNGEPYDGSGPISQEVNRAKTDGDIFWAVAGGNFRLGHWEGAFVDTNGDGQHEFDPGVNVLNILAYDGSFHAISGPFVAALTWNDWPVTDQDYDLYLLRGIGNNWVVYDFSILTQDGDDPPTELIYNNLPPGYYALLIVAYNQSGPAEYLELLTIYHDQDTRYRVQDSSVVEPATADGAVAMVVFNWSTPDTLESFSSMGPRNPTGGGAYDPNACGSTPTAECKPDFAGPDWVSTVSFGAQNFGGTSTAAPHMAGMAALVQDAHSTWTSDQIYDFLRERAPERGILSTSQDSAWGWGRSYLGDAPDPTAVTLTRFEAIADDNGILLQWETATEIDVLGFHLYRADALEGEYARTSTDLIPSNSPGSPVGATYAQVDSDVEAGATYYYKLEAVDVNGLTTFHGPVQATAEATTLYRVFLPAVSR